MALPAAAPDRQLVHCRSIDVKTYARGQGLWEVDAHITDKRTQAIPMAFGTLPAGEPIHDMLLRLVVNESFDIVEAGAETRAMPYPGHCETYRDLYSRLVGLNLMKGFRRAVQERLGGVQGCTHITELSLVLPTAVVQAFAGSVLDVRGDAEDSPQPFQIDRCRALRAEGEVVKVFFPRWFHPSERDAATPTVSKSVSSSS